MKSNTARLEREIVRDGLEDLGTVAFGATAVVGDPSEMQAPAGSQRWHGLAVKGGQWRVFGRPTPDGDAFSEIVAVHVDAIGAFWDLYDEAGPVAAMVLPTARVLVVDGGRRTDAALLQSASEPDDLPWVLDDGIVLAGLEQHPAYVWAPRGPVIALFAVALDAAPTERASSQAHSSSDQPDEEAD